MELSGAALGGTTSREEPILDYLDASDNVFFILSGRGRVTIYSLAGKSVSFVSGRRRGVRRVSRHRPPVPGQQASRREQFLVATMPAACLQKTFGLGPSWRRQCCRTRHGHPGA